METGNYQNNVTADLYPGIRAIKTRNVCNYINRFAYELEKHEDLILFERVKEETEPDIQKLKWLDRVVKIAKKWVEEDLD
ncbi:hypothetical protein ACFLRY_04595 [Bacteroidota bacterium]